MVVGAGAVAEQALGQGKLGAPARGLEVERHGGLVLAWRREIGGLMPGPGEDQPPRWIDLEILAGDRPACAAALGLHTPGSADTQVELAEQVRHAVGAKPFHELRWIGPRRKHALGGRVEGMDHAQCAVVSRGACGHGFSSWAMMGEPCASSTPPAARTES